MPAHARQDPPRPPKPSKLGALPEWNLDDLYPGIDSPELKRDLEQRRCRVRRVREDFKGRLAGAGRGRGRARARRGGEALRGARGPARPADLLCRRWSMPATRTDPVRAKFYGDVQERITAASLHLLFFTLELNRIDDAVLDAAMADPALGHYRPWIEDVRKEKPYQLEDRVEQLFHEKSVTGYSAWNRLFDETIAALRFKIGGKSLAHRADAQSAAGRRRQEAQGGGGGAGQDLQGKPAAVHADHQHARQGQGNLRPLARLRGRRRRAPSVQPGRARGGGGAGRRRCARPIRGCRTAITR